MGRPASVKSIDALQAMSTGLQCFRDEASSALDDLEIEIRRALQWIGQDCRQYWHHEVRQSRDKVTEAKLQLQHAMMFRRIDDEQRASCIEEKKALEQAKRRLQIAESKIEAISHWTVAIDRAVNEYRGSRSQFVNWLEADFPRAVAVLGRMIAALETYVRLGTPVDEHSPTARSAESATGEAKTAETSENNNESRTSNTESERS